MGTKPEQFKWVKGYEGMYEIGDRGTVMSWKTGKRKERRHALGYYDYHKVLLARDAVDRKTVYVHRLVAEAFVENPCGYGEVDHLDGDCHNNCASNLEWVTRGENMKRAFNRSGKGDGVYAALKARRRVIVVSDEMYGEGEEWESGRAWAIAHGNENKAGNVCTACRTGVKWYGKYFRYRDEPIPERLVMDGGEERYVVSAGCEG